VTVRLGRSVCLGPSPAWLSPCQPAVAHPLDLLIAHELSAPSEFWRFSWRFGSVNNEYPQPRSGMGPVPQPVAIEGATSALRPG